MSHDQNANATGDIEIQASTLDTGAIGQQPDNVWAAAEEKVRAKSQRGGRGASRGHSDGNRVSDREAAKRRREQQARDRARKEAKARDERQFYLRNRHDNVVKYAKDSRKIAMMGRAAIIWQPKDAAGNTTRFVEVVARTGLGVARGVYLEPVYTPDRRGHIARIDVLQLVCQLDYVNQRASYTSKHCFDLWQRPVEKAGPHVLDIDNQSDLIETALNLFEDLSESCVTRPVDKDLPAVRHTDDKETAPALSPQRVLPRLVAGTYARPVFDPNNLSPELAEDVAGAAEFFETLIIEPGQDGNTTELFFVPLGFYAKWPEKASIFEDFKKTFHVEKDAEGEILSLRPNILFSELSRDDAMYNLLVEGVPASLDLRPWEFEAEEASDDSVAETSNADTAINEATLVS